jgi:FlaA1/EpsC-like NDP-sugar epimerase
MQVPRFCVTEVCTLWRLQKYKDLNYQIYAFSGHQRVFGCTLTGVLPSTFISSLARSLTMKRSAVFLACSIALTLLFYLLAYFLLSPPQPTTAMTLLFAGIAMALVWVVQMCIHCLRSGKQNTHTVKLLLVGLGAGMLGVLLLGISG